MSLNFLVGLNGCIKVLLDFKKARSPIVCTICSFFINPLFNLLEKFLLNKIDNLNKKNIKLKIIGYKNFSSEEIINEKKSIDALSLYWTFLLIVWIVFFLIMYVFNDTVIAWCRALLG